MRELKGKKIFIVDPHLNFWNFSIANLMNERNGSHFLEFFCFFIFLIPWNFSLIGYNNNNNYYVNACM